MRHLNIGSEDSNVQAQITVLDNSDHTALTRQLYLIAIKLVHFVNQGIKRATLDSAELQKFVSCIITIGYRYKLNVYRQLYSPKDIILLHKTHSCKQKYLLRAHKRYLASSNDFYRKNIPQFHLHFSWQNGFIPLIETVTLNGHSPATITLVFSIHDQKSTFTSHPYVFCWL